MLHTPINMRGDDYRKTANNGVNSGIIDGSASNEQMDISMHSLLDAASHTLAAPNTISSSRNANYIDSSHLIGQKRQSSNSLSHLNSTMVKRRVAKNEDDRGNISSTDDFISSNITTCNSLQNTPLASPRMSILKKAIHTTPQPLYASSAALSASPFLLPMASYPNSQAGHNSGSLANNDKLGRRELQPSRGVHHPLREGLCSQEVIMNTNSSTNLETLENQQNNYDQTESSNKDEINHNESGNTFFRDNTIHNGSGGNHQNDENNDNNNDDNNNNDSSAVPSVTVPHKKSSQILVQKLQDIYKVIVKQEIELQERCSQLTTSQTTDLKNLWAIYRINVDLMNNYIAFITTALLPSQPKNDLLIGQEIVDIYRIERRLWVYGTITFLDVLKNFSNFMDPEVCCQFISHVFISISNMITDIPPKYANPWLQRLGDLSRMAIALYPSGCIDWKASAERWYMSAMEVSHGYGKLYYHMSTVQQNTLEAFVNLGKSVFCKDTFVPSQQYMQLVIDNIYQRAYAERHNLNNRGTRIIIDYLKHTEVMLLPTFLESSELQQAAYLYFRDNFGSCYNSELLNVFDTHRMFIEKHGELQYFFRHAPAFAESHILQLVGFGNPKNPFAVLFELPKFLKERKDKKERRKSKSPSTAGDQQHSPESSVPPAMALNGSTNSFFSQMFFENIDTLKGSSFMPQDLATWIESLSYVHKTSLQCNMIVFKKFLQGPPVIALPHLLPWTYFLISVAYKMEELSSDEYYTFWNDYVKLIFPWNTLVNFLNMLIAYALDNATPSSAIHQYCEEYSSMDFESLLKHFNQAEELPEIWKCWGTLWFDIISMKTKPADVEQQREGTNLDDGLKVKDCTIFDLPVDGIGFDAKDETGERFWKRACRAIFLFKGITSRFPVFAGLTISQDATVFCRRNDVPPNHVLRSFSFKLRREADINMSYTGSWKDMLSDICEPVDDSNYDLTAAPALSTIHGESIFEYTGYKTLEPDYACYDKNGDFISASLYTNIDNVDEYSSSRERKKARIFSTLTEDELFIQYLRSGKLNPNNKDHENDEGKSTIVSPYTLLDIPPWKLVFILDATSWLRHFSHIYKISTHGILRFGICLTTFQELRFLRKSKDENVMEAATRAVITLRQLYNEGKLLPMRFTGNVATHIEEHLEFEEQITWRSHVDEFVLEALMKAQTKREEEVGRKQEENIDESVQDTQSMHPTLPASDSYVSKFNFKIDEPYKSIIGLVTDDETMRVKAYDMGICTFSTKIIFAMANVIRSNKTGKAGEHTGEPVGQSVCTN